MIYELSNTRNARNFRIFSPLYLAFITSKDGKSERESFDISFKIFLLFLKVF